MKAIDQLRALTEGTELDEEAISAKARPVAREVKKLRAQTLKIQKEMAADANPDALHAEDAAKLLDQAYRSLLFLMK